MPIIRDIVYGAVRAGANLAELCRNTGITIDELDATETRLDFEVAQNVWEQSLQLTKDPFLGLHIGESSTPSIVGLVGHLMQTSPDIKTAFENLCSYNRVITDVFSYSTQLKDDTFIITYQPIEIWQQNSAETAKSAVEQAMSGSLHVIKLLCGRDIFPFRAEMKWQRPQNTQEYERVLKAELCFGSQQNRLYFWLTDVKLPVVGYNKELQELFGQLLDETLNKINLYENISAATKTIILKNYKNNFPLLEEVADALKLTPRSLQRRLKDEGTTFQKLQDELKQELAFGLLKSNKYTINEMAYMLGYAEPSVFRRAFKRWTGLNPSSYEKQILEAHI